MSIDTESRRALGEFITLLREIDEHWCSEERNLHSAEDVAGSHRALMHILEASLVGYFEQDAGNPDFRRIVTPSHKLTGDNSDAIYFDAPVSAEHSYLVQGSLHGAAYFSLTIEEGAQEGHLATTLSPSIWMSRHSAIRPASFILAVLAANSLPKSVTGNSISAGAWF